MSSFYSFLKELNNIGKIENNSDFSNEEIKEETERKILGENIENSREEDMLLKEKHRYLQIAFNHDLYSVNSILPSIPESKKILIEAGTPLIKKEGMNAVRRISSLWSGYIIADMKVADGAAGEVEMAADAGASAVTALGNAPLETLDLFIERCKEREVDSMIDMIGVENPLKILMKLKFPPRVVILHRGRDEESNRNKTIPYKEINKIKGKYSSFISAAGGVDLREARSAIFNGADIVVVNIVDKSEGIGGIDSNSDIAEIASKFLETVD